MSLPSRERIAHHEAGHAVIQHRLARGRYRVIRVSLDSDRENSAGSSLLDREVMLGLYEFGLATLAGIAAENRYYKDTPPPEENVWGAIGDLREWLAMAHEVLDSDARVELVTRNIMKQLEKMFDDDIIWQRVRALAHALFVNGTLEGDDLSRLLNN